MDWPRFARRLLLADQRISEYETEMIKRAVLEDGVVDREEVEFLVSLKREAVSVHPEFDRFLFAVLKKVVLADGVITDAEAQWLRKIIFADNQVVAAEVDFVKELRREAARVGKEFERLFEDCTRLSAGDFAG